MSAVVRFIEARLTEAETAARAVLAELALERPHTFWEEGTREHAEWTLRDVAAKRKLLEAHIDYYGAEDDKNLPVPTLTILAGIWADHEDYPALFAEKVSQ